MNWLSLVIVSVLSDSSRIYVDNYISDFYFKGREAAAQKFFYAIAFIIVAAVVAAVFGLDLTAVPVTTLLLLVASGVFSSLAGIPYYKALELDNSTNLGIFVQIAPILYLVLGWLFLGETISLPQFLSFFVIISAPLLIVLSAGKRSRHIRARAVLYAFLYVLIHVVGNLIFVTESSEALSLPSSMALVIFGKGLGNIAILLFYRKWARRFLKVFRSSHGKVLRPLTASLALDFVKDFAYKTALLVAPSVALASATSDSAEPIVIFFMGIILTLLWPKFGREKLNRRSILVHLVATILVVAGILLLRG